MSPSTHIRTAICICTYNRATLLGPLLEHLADIDCGPYDPATIEIIVIDNGPGDDQTRATCEAIGPRLPIALHYVPEPQVGITHARNRAVAAALDHGVDFIAFIDDDDRPRPDWLRQLLDCQAQHGADLVCGIWMAREDESEWLQKSSQLGKKRPEQKLGDDNTRRFGLPSHASTCNMLVGRSIVERLAQAGPVFCHNFLYSGGEDKDFVLRAKRAGAHIVVCHDSVVLRSHEAARYTAKGVLRRGFKNGCSRVNLLRNHGTMAQLWGCVGGATAKLLVTGLLFPLSALSKNRRFKALYRMAKAAGAIYAGFTGRSINYYAQ